MSGIDTKILWENDQNKNPIKSDATQNRIKDELEQSPEKKLEEILNELKNKIEWYKMIPIDIKNMISPYRERTRTRETDEEIEQKIKGLSESFYGTILKATWEQNNAPNYDVEDHKKLFEYRASKEMKEKIIELINPLVKYHVESIKTKLRKGFIISTILYNWSILDVNDDQFHDSLIVWEEKFSSVKASSRINNIAKYIDNNDYNWLSEYIKDYVKKITEKYEKELSTMEIDWNEAIKTYVLEESKEDNSITIITWTWNIFKITKKGTVIPMWQDRWYIKRLKDLKPLKKFDATDW